MKVRTARLQQAVLTCSSVKRLREATALIEKSLPLCDRGGFGVDAQDGFCAGLAEEEPRLVVEDELRAVERLDRTDGELPNRGDGARGERLDEREAAGDFQLKVAPTEVELPELAVHLAHQLGRRLARRDDRFEQEQR